MTEEPFLSALHESPNDDVTWLALADWLEENDQADRAELVRLVRQLRDVPVIRRSKKRTTLEKRIAQLLMAGARPAVPEITSSIGLRLALIPPGRFRMGSPRNEAERGGEEVSHQVEITKPFYLGVVAITQAQFERIMGFNAFHCSANGPGRKLVARLDTSDFPAEMVSWNDAVEFCSRLSQLDGRTYRLPTEAEWEYACRAGTTTAYYFGNKLSVEQANFDGLSPHSEGTPRKGLGRTCKVGSYPPNAFGLYDMHGNVFTWCSDWMADYDPGLSVDPQGPEEGNGRTIRGGGWACEARYCRAANRGRNDSAYRGYQNGVRVAFSAPTK
jgi:uncharacterized protein (TIGR02996 family)